MFTQLWPKDLQSPWKPANAVYTGKNIKPLAVISVQVEVNNQKLQLEPWQWTVSPWLRLAKPSWTRKFTTSVMPTHYRQC